MKTNSGKKLCFVLLAIAAICVLPQYTFAETFDLSYTLSEGGYRLELTQADPYKGVEITINTDAGTRYEVYQRITIPFTNRDNPGQQLRQNFVFRGLRGTNKFGDLRVPADDSPVKSDETLYVSNATGTADSFTLAYGITRPEDLEPGHYYGQLTFILNPIASGRQQVTQMLDVYVTIAKEAAQPPAIQIATAEGSKVIRLNAGKEEMLSGDAVVTIEVAPKNLFSILQFVPQALESTEGSRLDYEVLNFQVRQVSKGAGVSQVTPLSPGLKTIYTSSPSGQADNSFVVTYTLSDISQQKAGKYRGNIQYFLEEKGVQKKLDTLELEIENERIFDLVITPQDQRYSIEFQGLKPNEPAKTNEVVIEAKTNIGRQYQVSQELYSELTNKEGDRIPSKYFTLRTESIGTKGRLQIAAQQEAKKGSTLLFTSDALGSADKFKVIYQLDSPADLKAGDYSTRITYSLLEI